jgi:hypothetical protein
MPQPPLDQADRVDDVNVVRKTLLGLPEFCQCPDEIALAIIAVMTNSKTCLRQIWIERERAIERFLGCRQPLWARIEAPVEVNLLRGKVCPSQNKIWIQLYRLLK